MDKDKYSYFVKILKITFLVIVICNVILLFALVKTGSLQSIKLEADKKSVEVDLPPTIVNNPSYFGLSKDGNKYSIHADIAKQESTNKFSLDNIVAKYFLEKNEYVNLTADFANADAATKLIDLYKNIEIVFSGGYRMLTEKLAVDANSLTARSDVLVTITGTRGKIIAQNGLLLNQLSKNIEFYGPVKTVLYSQDNHSRNDMQTIIDSDKLEVDYQDKTAKFIGNILLVRNDLKLQCNEAIVYADKLKSEGSIDISKIKFIGDVVVEQAGKIAKSDTGEFDAKKDTITLLNNVSLTEDGNYIEGSELVYNLTARTATMNSGELIHADGDRVRVLILDKDDKK